MRKKQLATKDQLYITLNVHQSSSSKIRRETQFILQKRICDICQKPDNQTEDPDDTVVGRQPTPQDNAVMVYPYVNHLFNLNDDLIITIWLCPSDFKEKILAAEQERHLRSKLDSGNSFIIESLKKPVYATVETLREKKSGSMAPPKVLDTLKMNKARTKCQFSVPGIQKNPCEMNVSVYVWQGCEPPCEPVLKTITNVKIMKNCETFV